MRNNTATKTTKVNRIPSAAFKPILLRKSRIPIRRIDFNHPNRSCSMLQRSMWQSCPQYECMSGKVSGEGGNTAAWNSWRFLMRMAASNPRTAPNRVKKLAGTSMAGQI